MAEKIRKEPDLTLQVTRHEPVRVDEKGRITLQKEIRDALGTDVKLVCDASKVMRIYPAQEFDEIRAKVESRFSKDNVSAKYYLSAVYSHVRFAEIDNANRLNIPADLRKLMGIDIKDECVVIASGRDFTLMSGSAYSNFIESPVGFMASQRQDLDTLRKKAFEEEEELRRLERLLSPE
ncbi:MAG: hypothetical protein JST12_20705 [Armatimonadetes bacterium]|nr:hypothetical protein [Armatimonadota bacterium]MBS1704096.1 hypothetical protein [Armatimonadota bacterium]MBS1725560.1 hypothetical protein [Armatimonadota bacterium]